VAKYGELRERELYREWLDVLHGIFYFWFADFLPSSLLAVPLDTVGDGQ